MQLLVVLSASNFHPPTAFSRATLADPALASSFQAITLMRTSWKDAIAASPPLLVTLAFKIFVLRPYATQFKYFVPSPDELADLARESQRSYKQRFVHPALGDETLFTIMVHGEQQELVRMILAPYSRKLQSEVAGVREVRPRSIFLAPSPRVAADADFAARHDEQKDLAEYNPDLDQTLHLQQIEPGTKDDELASHVGGDGDSVLHAPVYPALERTISDQSGHGGGGGYYDRDNESEVDLVHSAAPMAGGESGWFSRQQQQHYQQPDVRPPLPLSLTHARALRLTLLSHLAGHRPTTSLGTISSPTSRPSRRPTSPRHRSSRRPATPTRWPTSRRAQARPRPASRAAQAAGTQTSRGTTAMAAAAAAAASAARTSTRARVGSETCITTPLSAAPRVLSPVSSFRPLAPQPSPRTPS